jgi:flagellar motility protein MotE (MotC chaperone)
MINLNEKRFGRSLIQVLREVRLVPVVLVATIALFSLKSLGLILDGGYLLGAAPDDNVEITGAISAPRPTAAPAKPKPAPARQSWAQQMFNYPDVTGAVGATPAAPKEEAPKEAASKPAASPAKPQEPPPAAAGTPVLIDPEHPVSPAERAILESLQKRRAELDARAREIDIREDLLRAAEKRLEGRLAELKDIEARVNEALQQKDDAEAARFKNLVTMYENMKAKDAAKIFDGLDLKVLLQVAKEINPRRMSDILAQMSPETAQRLTLELVARTPGRDAPQGADLPKIQGRPTSN